jgi:pyrroline-5-carboxylate reductase
MKLGFIGTGKIASAIVEGLCSLNIEGLSVNLSPRNEENSVSLAAKYASVTRLESNQAVLDQSDIIFISVTPKIVKSVLGELTFNSGHTIVSLVPLLKYADLAEAVSPAVNLSRAIPLPSVVNHNCPIPLYKATDAIIELFAHIGQPLIVNSEEELHAIWTLTGLVTPFYDLLGELSQWTTTKGVAKETADKYIANLFQSLTYMAQHAEVIDFEELAKHAATPNGMNEQAGKEIKEKGAHQLYITACEHLLDRFK